VPLKLPSLRETPHIARAYLLAGIFFIALPSIMTMYPGHEGKFIVSTAAIKGEPFEKTVIYLEHHDGFGARGVIINKPLLPDEARPDLPIEKEESIAVMLGGPVEQTEKFFYLDEKMKLQEYDPFDPNSTLPEKLYAGYAGWGMFQLNREISIQDAWAVIDYDPDLMGYTPSGDIWGRAMEKLAERHPETGI
jgi:putative AlgH/UPF0301 family transcriptional regulator